MESYPVEREASAQAKQCQKVKSVCHCLTIAFQAWKASALALVEKMSVKVLSITSLHSSMGGYEIAELRLAVALIARNSEARSSLPCPERAKRNGNPHPEDRPGPRKPAIGAARQTVWLI